MTVLHTMMNAGGIDKAAPYLILGAYMLSMVLIAILCHKKTSSLSGFFLADRGLGGWMSAFAYGTTYFSSVVFIGYAGKFGMVMGISSIWIGVANAVIGSFFAWLVLAKRTNSMSRILNTTTMPEYFEQRYQNKNIKLIASVIIFIFLIPYSTSVYLGIGMLFKMVFEIDFYWCILFMAVLTALYLFSGGYFATAISDFIQGIIMIIGVVVMLILMMKSPTVNGIEGLRKLSETGYGIWPSTGSGGKLIDSPAFNLVILILLTSFGIWSMPQSVHKFHAIKSNKAIKRAMVISTGFALIIGVSAYFNGSFARLFFPTGYPEGGADAVVPTMLAASGFSKAMLGFILVLVLSASMSTLSSLTLCSASAIAIDVYKGYFKKDAEEAKVKLLMRILCLVFVAISALLAILQVDAIVTLMSLSWGCLAGCFIGPYIYGLYSKKVTGTAAMVSIISGVSLTVLLVIIFGVTTDGADTFGKVIKSGVGRSPLIGVITMTFSMIITPVISLFTKKPDAGHVEKCFSKVAE